MMKRVKVALMAICAVAMMIGCNTSSHYQFSEVYYFVPYARLADTTFYEGDSTKIGMDTVLFNYFVEEETAYAQNYGGAGETAYDVYEQIYEALEKDYDKNVETVEKYDYNALLGGFAEEFNGTVYVVYEAREAKSNLWAFRDTVAVIELEGVRE